MLRQQHERFDKFDLDSKCAASNFPQLAFIFSCHVLKEDSNIAEGDDLNRAAYIFVSAVEEPSLERRIDVLETPYTFNMCKHFPVIYPTICKYMI